MRRFTFKNALHHVMNRGLNGSVIFTNKNDKLFFIHLLHIKAALLKIKIFAYVVMDTHYHIILQNTSEKMSDFMRQLNSEYALYFRKKHGGRGYLFQDRYKSTLIQNEIYLKTAILYTLMNPVRAGIVQSPFEYEFSSINQDLNDNNKFIDYTYIDNLISIDTNNETTKWDINIKEGIKNTRFGEIIGEDRFEEDIEREIETREADNRPAPRRRENEWGFIGVDELEQYFLKTEGIDIGKIDTRSRAGKRIRLLFLVLMRERCGLTYTEINKHNIFQDVKLYSLSHMYFKGRLYFQHKKELK